MRAGCLASRTHLSLALSRLKNAKTRPLSRRVTEMGLQKDKGFVHQKFVHNFIIKKKNKKSTTRLVLVKASKIISMRIIKAR